MSDTPAPPQTTPGADLARRKRRYKLVAALCLVAWIGYAIVTGRILISLPLASLYFWWKGVRKEPYR